LFKAIKKLIFNIYYLILNHFYIPNKLINTTNNVYENTNFELSDVVKLYPMLVFVVIYKDYISVHFAL